MTGTLLRQELADYLALRRALGYRMARPEKLLNQFLDYLAHHGASRITVAAALDWARLPANGSSNWWAYRLSAVRGFATYLHALDPTHEVPAPELLPQRTRRASPYLYSDTEVAALIAATSTLRGRLRQATFATLIGLLAVSGIRVGEAIALDRGDVDLTAGRLTVRSGKFGKTRELVAAPQQHRRAAPLPAAAQPARPDHRDIGVLCLAGRKQVALLQRSSRIPPAGALGRAHPTLVVVSAADS